MLQKMKHKCHFMISTKECIVHYCQNFIYVTIYCFGGIIIAFAFILDLIIGAAYGQNLNSPAFLKSFGSNYAFSNLILSVGKIGMSLAVSILAAFISFHLLEDKDYCLDL